MLQNFEGQRPVHAIALAQWGLDLPIPRFEVSLRGLAAALPLLVLACSTAWSQTQIDLPTQTKRVDFTGASYTRPFKSGNTLPATCAVGDVFFNIAAAPGLNIYACTAANTWTVESSAGSSSGASLTIESNGVAVGARSVADIIAGAGVTSLVTDTGSQINLQFALDTALVQTQFGEQSGVTLLCSSQSGSGAAYSCSMNPFAPAYTLGMFLHWIPDVAGFGGATTLNIDTLGAKSIKLDDGVTDPSSSSVVAGKMYLLWYDGSVFRMVSNSTATVGSGGSGSSGSGSNAYVADPGANGIPYRTGAGSATLASAPRISALFACVDNGSVNAYACSLAPAIGAYSPGSVYWFMAASANTGAVTLNLNSIGAVPIKKAFSQDLAANDIRAGQWVMIVYDGANMQMMSQTGSDSGAVSASALRSKDLYLGGYNNWGSGWAPAGLAGQTTGASSAGMVYMAFNHNSASNTWSFRWDANWDNSQPVNLLLTFADPSGNGGNFKMDWSVTCVPSGFNLYSGIGFGATASTGSITLGGASTREIQLSGLDVSTAACSPNMVAIVKASRDNTIAGNSNDDVGLYSATLVYSVK